MAVGEGEKMVMDLQDATNTLGDHIAQSDIRLFGKSAAPIELGSSRDFEDSDSAAEGEENDTDSELGSDVDEEEDEAVDLDEATISDADKVGSRRSALRHAPTSKDKDGEDVAFAESDSELDLNLEDEGEVSVEEVSSEGESDEDDQPAWKRNLSQRAAQSFAQTARQRQTRNWTKLIYDTDLTPHQVVDGDDAPQTQIHSADDEDDLFQLARRPEIGLTTEDHFRPVASTSKQPIEWTDDVLDKFRGLFVTGADDRTDHRYEDAEGGFEDLENDGESHSSENESEDGPEEEKSEETKARELAEKKEALKRKFNARYDDDEDGETKDFFTEQKEEMLARLEATRKEFAGDDAETRALIEGHRPGAYVRLELQGVPCEMVEKFDPRFPIIVGGLLPHEQSFGFVQVRIKKHRWHHRVLKTNDPLVFSLGWRRFQTVPVYSLDDNSHNRMLKYTPEHMHCLATFYGPISAPNSGFCAFNSLSNNTSSSFRVTATGTVLDVDGSSQIVKKLKLTGTPYKIFKNTAFIKEMFNSALEVAKFEGAQIRTVSGIRGQIKKALSKPEGSFRATFEDRILASDLVFLRTWYQVQPKKYYYPVDSLLLDDKSSFAAMRLTGQVRIENNVKTPNNANSQYKVCPSVPIARVL